MLLVLQCLAPIRQLFVGELASRSVCLVIIFYCISFGWVSVLLNTICLSSAVLVVLVVCTDDIFDTNIQTLTAHISGGSYPMS